MNIRLAIVGADVPYNATNLQTFVESAFTAMKTFHSASSMNSGIQAYLQKASAARIGTDGKYDPDTQNTVYSVGAASAGTSTAMLPWNSASVISLRTDRPRGRASNGRLYWPALAVTIDSTTGRISAGDAQGRANAAGTFLTALNTAAQAYATNMRVAVMSSIAPGLTALVKSVRVDNRLDSIERRENAVPPVYYTATVS